MEKEVWIKRLFTPQLRSPVAVVGSPGLRSVGKLVVESVVNQMHGRLMAELYSVHLPSVYETKPSYAAHPSMPGSGGAIIDSGNVDLPKVQFYACNNPDLVVVNGYHPNFSGQYSVAEKVVDFLDELEVKRIIVVAGFGSKEKKVCCAATSPEVIQEMKENYGVEVGYRGPFMGFSGLVFGMAKLKGIEALCLFSSAEPKEDNLEFPDEEAAQRALEKLNQMLVLQKWR